MGTWSKAYGMLAERSDQKPVADFFRAGPPELISWIHALTNLRNTCAHHSRLWDRRFVTCPSRKGNLKTAVTTNDRLFAQITACLYCLWSVEPASQWFAKLSLPRTLHHHPRRSRPPPRPRPNPPNSCGQSHPGLGFRRRLILIGPMSTALRKTPIELYRLGVAALDQALGPVVESLRLLDPGSGETSPPSARREWIRTHPALTNSVIKSAHPG